MTIVIAHCKWAMTLPQISAEHDLAEAQVQDALAFYQAHQAEIDENIRLEAKLDEVSG